MATIIQVNHPINEIREIVCITMEEWLLINKFESNNIVVEKEPSFQIGSQIEIGGGKDGQSASAYRIVKNIQKDAENRWIITFNAKGEKRKKASVLTIRLNEEEAEELKVFKKLVGKRGSSEALKFIIKEFPRWKKVMNETFEECREKERKYENLKKVNINFIRAFQDMVDAINDKE